MLKVFTKKDKRTKLEREIDEIKVMMDKMKLELDKSNSEGLDYEIKSLFDAMSNIDAGTEKYLNMAKAQEALHKAKANVKSKQEEYSELEDRFNALNETLIEQQKRKDEIKKILINGTFYFAVTAFVVKHEDVNVITSKMFSRLPLPKL